MTKEEFIAAAVRFGVVDSNAIDDAEEYDNSETYTALCSLYDFALAEPNALDAQGPRADCSPPDMPTAAAPAGLSAEPTDRRFTLTSIMDLRCDVCGQTLGDHFEERCPP